MKRLWIAALLLLAACRRAPEEAKPPWEGLHPDHQRIVREVLEKARQVDEANRRGREDAPAPGTVRARRADGDP